jgi:hypothetical protein
MNISMKFLPLHMPAPSHPKATMMGIMIATDDQGHTITEGPFLGRSEDEIRQLAEPSKQKLLEKYADSLLESCEEET